MPAARYARFQRGLSPGRQRPCHHAPPTLSCRSGFTMRVIQSDDAEPNRRCKHFAHSTGSARCSPDRSGATTMKTIVTALIGLLLFGSTALFSLRPARAHGWYPKDCCHDNDCAPVESLVRLVPAGGGAPQLVVTSKHGKAIVPQDFPVRESKDGRMHVCMRHDPWGGMDVMCLFIPPGV